MLPARFEGSQFTYKTPGGAQSGCKFLQKFMEKLVALQERQKEVLEGVTAVIKVTDYKTQVYSIISEWSHLFMNENCT